MLANRLALTGKSIYTWKKYNTNTTTTYSNDRADNRGTNSSNDYVDGSTFPTTWSFNSTQGYVLGGPYKSFSQLGIGGAYYDNNFTGLLMKNNVTAHPGGSPDYYTIRTDYYRQCDYSSSQSRGSYIADVTSTDPNAYPYDAYNSNDGYWYVKQ